MKKLNLIMAAVLLLALVFAGCQTTQPAVEDSAEAVTDEPASEETATAEETETEEPAAEEEPAEEPAVEEEAEPDAAEVAIKPAVIEDGTVANWVDADWTELVNPYHGGPAPDMYNARWAAMWTPEAIVVRVELHDASPHLTSSNEGWNAQDSIEIYFDPGNTMFVGYNADYASAQQFVICPEDGSGNEWVTLGPSVDGKPYLTALDTGVVAGAGDAVYVYEVALTPYEDLTEESVLTLEAGMTVGLEVIANSVDADGNFHMIAGPAYELGGKFQNAAAIQTFELVD